MVVRIGSLTNPLFVLMGRSLFTGARSFFSWSAAVQQRDITRRLTITRLRPGASSMAINPRPSASLMAARVLALPMLARSAIRATGRVHFPVVWASFRMTASTAIASMFNCSATSGGTTTVAARNRRPHTTRRAGSVLLLSAAVNSRPLVRFRPGSVLPTHHLPTPTGGCPPVTILPEGRGRSRPLVSVCLGRPRRTPRFNRRTVLSPSISANREGCHCSGCWPGCSFPSGERRRRRSESHPAVLGRFALIRSRMATAAAPPESRAERRGG